MTDPAESPVLVLQGKLTELADSTHDTLTDIGCDCEYVIGVSWQQSTRTSPMTQIRHTPECSVWSLPEGEPDATPPKRGRPKKSVPVEDGDADVTGEQHGHPIPPPKK